MEEDSMGGDFENEMDEFPTTTNTRTEQIITVPILNITEKY